MVRELLGTDGMNRFFRFFRHLFVTIVGLFFLALSVPSFAGDNQGVVTSRETATGLTFTYTPSLDIRDKIVGGKSYKRVTLKTGGGLVQNYGYPQMPFLSRLIAIPEGATVDVKVKSVKSHTVQSVSVMPSPPMTQDNPQYKSPPKKEDEKAYSKNNNFPGKIYEFEEKIKVGGVRTGLLRLYPAQFNPVKRALLVHDEILVNIQFKNAKTGSGAFMRKNKKTEGVFLNKKTVKGTK